MHIKFNHQNKHQQFLQPLTAGRAIISYLKFYVSYMYSEESDT